MTDLIRHPQHYYQDPLAQLWIAGAEGIGFRVVRSAEVYASTDGRGTLLIGIDEILDPDDSLAQMIFHELCHALVEGEAGEAQVDWGLDNRTKHHRWREHACLRLQAYLAGSVGLRAFLAPTTDFRVSFWQTLPDDALTATAAQGGRREPSCVAARRAVWRAAQPRWAPLRQALNATAAIAAAMAHAAVPVPAVRPAASAAQLVSLWSTVGPVPEPHPAGHSSVAHYYAERHCADCAWGQTVRGTLRCRHAPAVRLPASAPACLRWEPAAELDCAQCGACCREAYDAVEVAPRDAVAKRHPALVVRQDGRCKLVRHGERCAALRGGEIPTAAYHCEIYADRPRTCREFTRGSVNCLNARQRVGLSL